jgi:hypothetical protein
MELLELHPLVSLMASQPLRPQPWPGAHWQNPGEASSTQTPDEQVRPLGQAPVGISTEQMGSTQRPPTQSSPLWHETSAEQAHPSDVHGGGAGWKTNSCPLHPARSNTPSPKASMRPVMP